MKPGWPSSLSRSLSAASTKNVFLLLLLILLLLLLLPVLALPPLQFPKTTLRHSCTATANAARSDTISYCYFHYHKPLRLTLGLLPAELERPISIIAINVIVVIIIRKQITLTSVAAHTKAEGGQWAAMDSCLVLSSNNKSISSFQSLSCSAYIWKLWTSHLEMTLRPCKTATSRQRQTAHSPFLLIDQPAAMALAHVSTSRLAYFPSSGTRPYLGDERTVAVIPVLGSLGRTRRQSERGRHRERERGGRR